MDASNPFNLKPSSPVTYPTLPQLREDPSSKAIPEAFAYSATPHRANSSKRRQRRVLARPESSPSHRVRVANIFSDAADQLRSMSLSKPKPKPWMRKMADLGSPLARRAPRIQSRHRRTDEHGGPRRPHQITQTDSSGSDVQLPLLQRAGTGGAAPPDPPAAARHRQPVAGREPTSSGYASPTGLTEQPHRRQPTLGERMYPIQPIYEDQEELDPDDEFEIHSTHGVPLVLPIREPTPAARVRTNVDAWLEQVMAPDPVGLAAPLHPFHANATPPVLPHRPRTRSNKENVPPTAATAAECSRFSDDRSSTAEGDPVCGDDDQPLLPCNAGPVRCRPFESRRPLGEIPCTMSSPLVPGRTGPWPRARPPPRSPRGLVALAPRRKRQRTTSPRLQTEEDTAGATAATNWAGVSRAEAMALALPLPYQTEAWPPVMPAGSPYDEAGNGPGSAGRREPSEEGEIVEDAADGVFPLSRSVERFRKGRGPARNRRPSYFDEDILNAARPDAETQGDPQLVAKGA